MHFNNSCIPFKVFARRSSTAYRTVNGSQAKMPELRGRCYMRSSNSIDTHISIALCQQR